MISEETIKETVYQLYKKAVIHLNEDVKSALENALKVEDNELGILNIEAILKNIKLAEEKRLKCVTLEVNVHNEAAIKLYKNRWWNEF